MRRLWLFMFCAGCEATEPIEVPMLYMGEVECTSADVAYVDAPWGTPAVLAIVCTEDRDGKKTCAPSPGFVKDGLQFQIECNSGSSVKVWGLLKE